MTTKHEQIMDIYVCMYLYLYRYINIKFSSYFNDMDL